MESLVKIDVSSLSLLGFEEPPLVRGREVPLEGRSDVRHFPVADPDRLALLPGV